MNWLRNALIGGILIVVFLLFTRWNEFQEDKIVMQESEATPTPAFEAIPQLQGDVATMDIEPSSDLPTVTNAAPNKTTKVDTKHATQELIRVKTDTLDVTINPLGGDIVEVFLPQYLADINDKSSAYRLLTKNDYHTYIAESDLVGPNGTHTRDGRVLFSTADNNYQLDDSAQFLMVDLNYDHNGVLITKRFSFERGSHLVKIDYLIANNTESTWKGAMYGRIRRDDYKPKAGGMFQLQPYLGAATTTIDDKFKKFDFEELDTSSQEFDLTGGWVAMVQHYFVSAWIPDQNTKNQYKLHKSNDSRHYLLSYNTPLYSVSPGKTQTISSSFYAGPKIIKHLEPLSPGLDLTVDFGILWFIAKPLFLLLDIIHGLLGNWGFAIILLTFFVKLVFFYPSAISYRSMAKMRKLMPMMQELKERYGDDRQKMGMETMKLYKKEGVNPLGGCLPMLMQMPVFMALYWMIMESVELRHSPFLFWISDLSVRDPLYILPIFMGVLMYVQQKLNPPPQDPMQAKIFQMMPIGFTFILMFLPAALTLYMAVNTALSFLQQYVITKQIEKAA